MTPGTFNRTRSGSLIIFLQDSSMTPGTFNRTRTGSVMILIFSG